MKILLILSDAEITRRTSHLLRGRGFEVEEAHNGRQGFYRALSGRFSIVVIDPKTPLWDEHDSVAALAEARPLLRIVLVAADAAYQQELKERLQHVVQVVDVLLAAKLPQTLLPQVTLGGKQPFFRHAKIVATVGPASADPAILRELLEAGVDVVRLNFSHGTHAWHAQTLRRIREIAEELSRPIAVIQDLCGPKIRVGALEGGEIQLTADDRLTLHGDDRVGSREAFSISLPEVLGDLVPGDRVLLDDGNLELVVQEGGTESVVCRVIHGGTLRQRKGINLPGATLRLPGLTAKDKADLLFGIQHAVDFIAVSFVRTADHIQEVKQLIASKGAEIPVIAKIEKPEAVAALEGIMALSDAVMIARGDLGVELAATRVPHIQRHIIQLARRLEKPVITATQMLESMTEKPRPTRAEVADVTKAVEDGPMPVMLSGETACGRYPVSSVETMAAIVLEAESWMREASNPFLSSESGRGLVQAFSKGLAMISDNVDLSVIAVATRSGRTVLSLSKSHPDCPILALSDREVVLQRVCLYHGVYPARVSDLANQEDIFRAAENAAIQRRLVRHGDIIALIWDPEWRGGRGGSLAARFRRVEKRTT